MSDSSIELLLVEDNPADQELTLHVLKRHNLANRVKIARDGAEALDFIFGPESGTRVEEFRPRMILLDLKLPKLDGLGVLKRLRADPRTRTLPVVVLTSSSQDADVIASYNLGANSYVRKPVDFVEFTQAAKQLGLYWLLMNRAPPVPRRS
jgi:two-component system response regulator